jgi:hypothetical protein
MTSSDLQNRRYQIAKDYISVTAEYKENEKRTVPKTLARFAVACADALIEELTKEED